MDRECIQQNGEARQFPSRVPAVHRCWDESVSCPSIPQQRAAANVALCTLFSFHNQEDSERHHAKRRHEGAPRHLCTASFALDASERRVLREPGGIRPVSVRDDKGERGYKRLEVPGFDHHLGVPSLRPRTARLVSASRPAVYLSLFLVLTADLSCTYKPRAVLGCVPDEDGARVRRHELRHEVRWRRKATSEFSFRFQRSPSIGWARDV